MEKEKNWLIEVPQNLDPMTDMYEKKASEKSEKVAKNELQRLKNIARSKKVKIPRVGLPTSDKASATQVNYNVILYILKSNSFLYYFIHIKQVPSTLPCTTSSSMELLFPIEARPKC